MSKIKIVTIKAGMPSVDEARKKLIDEIETACNTGVRILKIIHGYGSTVVGGALRLAIRKSLNYRKKDGQVENIIYGERFDRNNEDIKQTVKRYPALSSGSDYNSNNEGVTIAILTPK
jgi:hypothetical protein